MTVAVAATVLSGCAATDSMMSTVALPNDRSNTSASGGDEPDVIPLPAQRGPGGTVSSKLMVTPQQRAYLDALLAAGLQPSSDLMALSIGSYICQARAAGKSPQAVWDLVHPLVFGDARNSQDGAHPAAAPTQTDVDAATHSYIRIATERLC